ncbi:MAG: hypothetical protein SF028_06465 [Candidatus Sumerlaeia bacterium]|nr:hypothetical protein [Candidatus Sumerlaeia bacterium]
MASPPRTWALLILVLLLLGGGAALFFVGFRSIPPDESRADAVETPSPTPPPPSGPRTYFDDYPPDPLGVASTRLRGTVLVLPAAAPAGAYATAAAVRDALLDHLNARSSGSVRFADYETLHGLVDWDDARPTGEAPSPNDADFAMRYIRADLSVLVEATGDPATLRLLLRSPDGSESASTVAFSAEQPLAAVSELAGAIADELPADLPAEERAAYGVPPYAGLFQTFDEVAEARASDRAAAEELLAKAPGDVEVRALVAPALLAADAERAAELLVTGPAGFAAGPAEHLLRVAVWRGNGARRAARFELLIGHNRFPGGFPTLAEVSNAFGPRDLPEAIYNILHYWHGRAPQTGPELSLSAALATRVCEGFVVERPYAELDAETLDTISYFREATELRIASLREAVGSRPEQVALEISKAAIQGQRDDVHLLLREGLVLHPASFAIRAAALKAALPRFGGSGDEFAALATEFAAEAANHPELHLLPYHAFRAERFLDHLRGEAEAGALREAAAADASAWEPAAQGLAAFVEAGPPAHRAAYALRLLAAGGGARLDEALAAVPADRAPLVAAELRRHGAEELAGRVLP